MSKEIPNQNCLAAVLYVLPTEKKEKDILDQSVLDNCFFHLRKKEKG